MPVRPLPPLPGVDPTTAPTPDDPGYCDWIESVGFSPEGVDRGLVWEQLHRTPEERLANLEEFVATILRMRRGRYPEIL
jgi:hypothetical protein